MTNFSTIKKSVARLKDIDKMKEDGRLANFTKKEVGLMMRERGKLENSLGGIKDMERLPAALFVVDSKRGACCSRGQEVRHTSGRAY